MSWTAIESTSIAMQGPNITNITNITSDNTTSYCFNFTANELRTNTGVTVSLHMVAIVACVVAIVFIFATKQHQVFVNRLVLYLMLASSLWSLAVISELIPVTHEEDVSSIKVREGWEDTCAVVGFVLQLVESAKILVVCWIVLYLLLLVVFKRNASTRTHEVIGLLVVVSVPCLLDWIPFRWHRYGLSGMWCWIRLTDGDCDSVWGGLLLMMAIEYVPVLLAVIFTVVSFTCITVALCRRAHRAEIKWKWHSVYQKGLEEAAALMVYPTIYGVIFVFRVIHRTYYVVQVNRVQPPNYTLWLAHSAALGIGGILVPLLYLLRPSNLKKFYLCRKFFLRNSGVVYTRSSSFDCSTEAPSDGDRFIDSEKCLGSFRDSSLVYKSILNSN